MSEPSQSLVRDGGDERETSLSSRAEPIDEPEPERRPRVERRRRRVYEDPIESTPGSPLGAVWQSSSASRARIKRAQEIVKDHTIAATAVGTVPVPVIDLAGLSVVQFRMLSQLAGLYEVEVSRYRAKAIIGALSGSLAGLAVGGTLAGSLFKLAPGVGTLFGAAAISSSAGAMTYALGRVFVQHFESGGTFLDFNPESVRQFYLRELEALASREREELRS